MSKTIFETLLKKRGLEQEAVRELFLHPDYATLADPYLMPDMKKAVTRLKKAQKNNEKVVIYGDYDIDGLSATTVLLDAFTSFGIDVSAFIPSRFDDGYGLSSGALTRLADLGAQLIVTVDCGSLSIDEVAYAKELGLEVIVTDHHNIGDTLPDAVAVINPKRKDHTYPFTDYSGVGVAFTLVRALQSVLPGIEKGHEKWLLDLVALGTVCDIVSLTGENRTVAYWGLKVMSQTRRPGLKALMAVAGVNVRELSAKSLGFGLGPRLNASGRLETAQLSLDLLTATDNEAALAFAQELDAMNMQRKKDQNRIFDGAKKQAEKFLKDDVLVLHDPEWSHGIIGIVAAKIVELHHKPTFVLQEEGGETKGSARSFGDFSVGDAIRYSEKHIIKGGGHTMAAGVSLETAKIIDFRLSVNEYYASLQLTDQAQHLKAKPDITLSDFKGIDESLVNNIGLLEPFGNDSPQPVFAFENLTVTDVRKMGDQKQHVKITFRDSKGTQMQCIAFSAPTHFFVDVGERVTICATLDINEWQHRRSVEGRLLAIDKL